MPIGQRDHPREPGKRVAADPALRADLETCERFRISHSHYLGGPALWTPEDRAKERAYREWARDTCSQCGTRPEHWDPKRGGHRFAFIAELERCPGCEVKEELRDQLGKTRGAHVVLKANPEVYPELYPHEGEAAGDAR